ncbi:hypothetical protein BSZ39_03390 [Bowdeniella nasicola]|uniref:Uncharacterized protein n=2 Tax=Bowdeniella nasicola TaxID=208480 RepID=A0A1Q5Q457_9ACTO|nr:hypothetical protein BSZ39_03390 [Bowdeniella nasicola]
MTDPLGRLASEPALVALAAEISEQAAALRFHEALRRHSAQARHAAIVASSTHLSDAAGLPPGGDLAEQIVTGQAAGDDPRWRCYRVLRRSLDFFGTLGGAADRTPPGQIISALRRDAGLPGAPPAGLQQAGGLMTSTSPAFVVTALIWAHAQLASEEETAAFGAGGPLPIPTTTFAAALASIHAVRSGLDPAGVSVVSDVEAPQALADYRAGSWVGALGWCEAFGQMWRAGLAAGRVVCDEVRAGRRGGAR